MEKLKTLKDLENRELKLEDYASESFEEGTRVYTKKRIDRFRNELKAEAVKWIKELDDDREPLNAVGFIKEFFNLTEEDLK